MSKEELASLEAKIKNVSRENKKNPEYTLESIQGNLLDVAEAAKDKIEKLLEGGVLTTNDRARVEELMAEYFSPNGSIIDSIINYCDPSEDNKDFAALKDKIQETLSIYREKLVEVFDKLDNFSKNEGEREDSVDSNKRYVAKTNDATNEPLAPVEAKPGSAIDSAGMIVANEKLDSFFKDGTHQKGRDRAPAARKKYKEFKEIALENLVAEISNLSPAEQRLELDNLLQTQQRGHNKIMLEHRVGGKIYNFTLPFKDVLGAVNDLGLNLVKMQANENGEPEINTSENKPVKTGEEQAEKRVNGYSEAQIAGFLNQAKIDFATGQATEELIISAIQEIEKELPVLQAEFPAQAMVAEDFLVTLNGRLKELTHKEVAVEIPTASSLNGQENDNKYKNVGLEGFELFDRTNTTKVFAPDNSDVQALETFELADKEIKNVDTLKVNNNETLPEVQEIIDRIKKQANETEQNLYTRGLQTRIASYEAARDEWKKESFEAKSLEEKQFSELVLTAIALLIKDEVSNVSERPVSVVENKEKLSPMDVARNDYIEEYNKVSKQINPGFFSKTLGRVFGAKVEISDVGTVEAKKAIYDELKKARAHEIYEKIKTDFEGKDKAVLDAEVNAQIIEALIVKENNLVTQNKVNNWPPEKQNLLTKAGSWYSKQSKAKKFIFGVLLGTGTAAVAGAGLGAIALSSAPLAVLKIALGKSVRSAASLAALPLISRVITMAENKDRAAFDSENNLFKSLALSSFNEDKLDIFVDTLDGLLESNQQELKRRNLKTGVARVLASVCFGVAAGGLMASEVHGAMDAAQSEYNSHMARSIVPTPNSEAVVTHTTVGANTSRPDGVPSGAAVSSKGQIAGIVNQDKIYTPTESAIVREGDGVERIFKNQLLADPKKFGYNPESGISAKQWAGTEAHRLAGDEGYLLGKGKFIGLKGEAIGQSAYVVETNSDGQLSVKYLHQENGVWKEQDGTVVNDWEQVMKERPSIVRPTMLEAPTEPMENAPITEPSTNPITEEIIANDAEKTSSGANSLLSQYQEHTHIKYTLDQDSKVLNYRLYDNNDELVSEFTNKNVSLTPDGVLAEFAPSRAMIEDFHVTATIDEKGLPIPAEQQLKFSDIKEAGIDPVAEKSRIRYWQGHLKEIEAVETTQKINVLKLATEDRLGSLKSAAQGIFGKDIINDNCEIVKGNNGLVEIRIPEGIISIHDGRFAIHNNSSSNEPNFGTSGLFDAGPVNSPTALFSKKMLAEAKEYVGKLRDLNNYR